MIVASPATHAGDQPDRGRLAEPRPFAAPSRSAPRRRRRDASRGSPSPAAPLAASALPPLKPNQPTHSMPAPAIVRPGLCGGCSASGKPRRGPIISATTSAETPGRRVHDDAAGEIDRALRRRASRRPIPNAPPAHRRAAATSALNSSRNGNVTRSGKAPTISAGVITAKVIWNSAKTPSGRPLPGNDRREPAEKRLARPAQHGAVAVEGQAVADHRPEQRHDAARRQSSASAPKAGSSPAPARHRTAPAPAGS